MLIGTIENVYLDKGVAVSANIKIVHTGQKTAEVYVNGFKIPAVASASIDVLGCNGVDTLKLTINAKNTEIIPFVGKDNEMS